MDRQLKQRLVGASVVVALAVIIVPEFVKQQPPQGEEATANVTSDLASQPVLSDSANQNASQAAVLIMPGGQPVQQAEALGSADSELLSESDDGTDAVGVDMPSESLAEAASRGNVDTASSVTAESAIAPAQELPPAVESADVTEPASTTTTQNRTTTVQTGSEPPPTKAKQAVAVVKSSEAKKPTPQQAETRPAAPSNPPSSVATTASRSATPKTSSNGAKQAVELPAIQLISRSQYAANTTSTQQVSRQPRWMVQAGSFYVAENASMLREKLRQQRFPASLQSAVVEGRTVYRVQVGPHATRAEGERTQARLLREAGINGNIVPVYN